MKKSALLAIILLLNLSTYAIGLKAENVSKALWGEALERPSKWSYGGTFGLNFIDKRGFLFQAGATLTYRAGNRVFLGVSSAFSYVYQSVEYQNLLTTNRDYFDYNSTYYDNSIFMRWFAIGLTFIQIEPGIVNYKDLIDYQYDYNQNKMIINASRKTVPYVQCGAGFVVPFGNEKFFIMRCMYDVLQHKDSPYLGLPIIRGGVNIGI
jgi:hypothetical protein